jgi:phospholipase D1/2
LDLILKERAENGVKIYIMAWNESPMKFLVDLGSDFVVKYFGSMSENIFAIRDPGSEHIIVTMWSHHQSNLKCSKNEEMVIIDQDIAYCGGIDLTFNRFEIPGKYPIFDVESKYFPGSDYTNPLIRTKNMGDFTKDYFDRTKEPRMPWNDIHCKIGGRASRDFARCFIQRWNHSIRKSNLPQLIPKSDDYPSNIPQTLKYSDCKVQVLRSVSEWGYGLKMVEKSIYEAYIHFISNAKHFIYIENQFFISSSHSNQQYPKNQIAMKIVEK